MVSTKWEKEDWIDGPWQLGPDRASRCDTFVRRVVRQQCAVEWFLERKIWQCLSTRRCCSWMAKPRAIDKAKSMSQTYTKPWRFIGMRYGASVGGSLCDTSKTYVRQVRLTSHESKPHKKHNSPNKHHHHGGGAANPWSGVDLMNWCRRRGGRPCAYFFRGRYCRILRDSLN